MSFRRWFVMGLLMVLASSFAASTGVMMVLREREVKRRIVAEEAVLRAKEVNQTLQKELSSHQARGAGLERELLALQRTNQFTLVRLKGVEKRLNRLQGTFDRERAEKQALLNEKSELNNQLLMAHSEGKSLKARLDKILARSSKEVDLGQIVVSTASPLEGKVLVVNEKYRFVVVDLGSEKALDVGTLLNVYREDQYIGRIQVDQVRESVAACKVLPEWTLEDIREEDRVREL